MNKKDIITDLHWVSNQLQINQTILKYPTYYHRRHHQPHFVVLAVAEFEVAVAAEDDYDVGGDADCVAAHGDIPSDGE